MSIDNEIERDRIPIAATAGRAVDYIDVTGWGVFKNHAIPVDVARFIAEKINLYAKHLPHPQPASAGPAEVGATHRHKKRGKEYVLIGFGKMQAEYWTDTVPTWEAEPSTSVDMREVAIYRSVYDGSLWARPREEFEDGRFEALTQQAPEKL